MATLGLSAEQQQFVTSINNYANQFPVSEAGEEKMLESCYDYMEVFKRIMDSCSKPQMDFICQQYNGFYRFAKLMERLAQGIANGSIEVPERHQS
jgi:hypothetical protein